LKYQEKVQKRALEIWETKLANCEVIPQAIWPIAKSLSKRGGPKGPSAIHGPLCPIFCSIDKANIIKLLRKPVQSACLVVTVTRAGLWRPKSKPSWLLLMKTSL
jgi:hypothetical protein